MTEYNVKDYTLTATSGHAMHVAAIAPLEREQPQPRPAADRRRRGRRGAERIPARGAAVYARFPIAGAPVEARQIADCRNYAHANGLELIETFSDSAAGRKPGHRPGLQRLMEAVRRGGLEALVVSDLDRLARRLPDLLAVFEELDRHGVELHECRDGRIELVHIFIRGCMAEAARSRFVARCRAGRRTALARKGVLPAASNEQTKAGSGLMILYYAATIVGSLLLSIPIAYLIWNYELSRRQTTAAEVGLILDHRPVIALGKGRLERSVDGFSLSAAVDDIGKGDARYAHLGDLRFARKGEKMVIRCPAVPQRIVSGVHYRGPTVRAGIEIERYLHRRGRLYAPYL